MKNSKLQKGDFLFIGLALIYSGLMFYLFYAQCTHLDSGRYFSDMKAYIQEINGIDSGYRFPYPVFFGLSKLLSFLLPLPVSVSLVLTSLNSLGLAVTYCFIRKELTGRHRTILATVASFSIFLVSMLYNPFTQIATEGWGHRYLGVFSPNPYQNATYIATRPFAILLFLQFCKILKNINGSTLKEYILLCLYMALSVLTKPSFLLVFAPVMLITTVIQWISRKLRLTKKDLYLVFSAVPTIIILIYQYLSVFDPSGEGKLRFGPGKAWHLWTGRIKESVLLAGLFCFLFLIFHIRHLKNNIYYLLSWVSYFVGLATFFLFYEDGFRIWDANFAWGYMHGLFSVFFTSICLLFSDYESSKMRKKWYLYPESAILLLHLVLGIYFFAYMLGGGSASKF